MHPTDSSSCAGIGLGWISAETMKLKHTSGNGDVSLHCTSVCAYEFSTQPCWRPRSAQMSFIKLEKQTGILPLFSSDQWSGPSCWMEKTHLKDPLFLTWERPQKQAEPSCQDNTEEQSFFLKLFCEKHLSPYKTFKQSQNQRLKSRCYEK